MKILSILAPATLFMSIFLLSNIYNAFIVTAFYLIIYLLIRFRSDILGEFLIALGFALFITINQKYIYTDSNIFIGSVNLYPLILWSVGLVLLREFYEYIGKKFFLTVVFYILAILFVEYIGYHLLGIRIDGNYPGIFGLDVIHGPPIIHYFYILAGPAYILVTKLFRIK